ncbi:hypothetical protein AAFX24_27995 [Vibrio mediterranei]|uniref:hypothetical protein n=1 Tax=Vibrio mediterranei TaxID=689 RepID=UPI0038CE5EED
MPNGTVRLYFCKEGDLPIYPRPTLVTNDIATLSFRTIPKLSNDNPNLVVIFDPTCPRCKAYYRDTLRQLSEQGNVIRIIPTLYKDRLTDKDYTAVHRLLCAESVKAGIEDIVYGRKESVEQCPISLSQVKQSIDKTRKSLSKHQLHTMAPISVSPKALWFGNLPISTVTKYL